MILISHRGNVNGKQPALENMPEYIDNAIELGYDVEIDIRVKDRIFYLGHDDAKYVVTIDWLKKRSDKLWLHCKNIEAIEWFAMIKSFNYFWHQNDDITITSKGDIWMNSKIQPIKNSIAVILENSNYSLTKCAGICSDNIKVYNERH